MSKNKNQKFFNSNNMNQKRNFNEKNIHHKYNFKDQNDSFHPWIKPDSKCLITSGMLKLHYEILDFCEFIQLTEEEKLLREKSFNYIKSVIEEKFTEYRCRLYGSFKLGLSLPDSDIDMLIIESEEKEKEKNNDSDNNNNAEINKSKVNEIIKNIYNILYSTNKFSYIEMIKAKVPIIKCTLKETGINVDISFFRKNGTDAVDIIDKVLKEYPEIKPLTLVIKYMLRQRQLNEIYKGGVSSFIIFSLIYYYISDIRKKILNDLKNGKREDELTLGHLLVGFFNFYGFMFDYDQVGISIRYGCFLYKRQEHKPNTLSIENFQDINQDMGKSCFNFRKVIDAFKNARDSLYYPEKSPVVSYLCGFILPDDILRQRAESKLNFNLSNI